MLLNAASTAKVNKHDRVKQIENNQTQGHGARRTAHGSPRIKAANSRFRKQRDAKTGLGPNESKTQTLAKNCA